MQVPITHRAESMLHACCLSLDPLDGYDESNSPTGYKPNTPIRLSLLT